MSKEQKIYGTKVTVEPVELPDMEQRIDNIQQSIDSFNYGHDAIGTLRTSIGMHMNRATDDLLSRLSEQIHVNLRNELRWALDKAFAEGITFVRNEEEN